MLKVFIGYVLVAFQMTSPSGFDLLPDFVGYFLIFLGLFSQRSRSRWFSWGAWASLVMTFVAMISPAQQYLKFPMGTSAVNILFDLLLAASSLILLTIVMGVTEVEDTEYVQLGSKRLKIVWAVQTVLQIGCGVLIWFAASAASAVAGVFSLCTFGLTISTVFCLFCLYGLVRM